MRAVGALLVVVIGPSCFEQCVRGRGHVVVCVWWVLASLGHVLCQGW